MLTLTTSAFINVDIRRLFWCVLKENKMDDIAGIQNIGIKSNVYNPFIVLIRWRSSIMIIYMAIPGIII